MIAGDSGPTIVYLYARVSTEEQTTAGTIENQVDRFYKWCELHDHTPGGIYRDESSGTIPFSERPGGARLLADAAEGLRGLVCVVRLDRIGRTVPVVLGAVAALESAGLRLASATEPFDTGSPWGKFALNILATFAEFERDSILFRSREGARRKALAGAYLGGKPPFGYIVENGTLAPDQTWIPEAGETVADLITRIFREVGEKGASSYSVADKFNALSIPPPEAITGFSSKLGRIPQRWHDSSITRMINNPVYEGKWLYGRIGRKNTKRPASNIIERPVPAIVSPELAGAARAQLLRNRLDGPKENQRRYLLTGKMYCGLCGAGFSGLTMKGYREIADQTDNARGVRYRCLTRCTRAKTGRDCDSPAIPGSVEAAVWGRILQWLAQPPGEIVKAATEAASEPQGPPARQEATPERIESLRRALGGIENQRAAVTGLFRRSLISEPDLLKQFAEIDREAAAIRTELHAAEAAQLQTAEAESSKEKAAELRQDFARIAEGATWETRRYVVETLIDKILVFPGTGKTPEVRIIWKF